MEYIKKRAGQFVKNYIHGQVDEHEKVIDEAKSELYRISSELDRITFLSIILEGNEKEYQRHLLDCTNKEECQINFEHESIKYYLGTELSGLGVRIDEDQFTFEERDVAENKLNRIIEDLNKIMEEMQVIKTGQQLSYDDLMAELEELKEFYILGKKKWFQLFLGKTTEMVIGGMISETVSKELIAIMGETYQKMLT